MEYWHKIKLKVELKSKSNIWKNRKIVGYDETTGENVVDKVFKINLSNISDNYRVEIYNDYTKENKDVRGWKQKSKLWNNI